MKNIIRSIGFSLAMVSLSAQAIPTLNFFGNINYTSDTQILAVHSGLFSAPGISPTPNLSGSQLDFTAILTGTSSNSSVTQGNFSGILGDDMTIRDGAANVLLTANFNSLAIRGGNGNNLGIMNATLTATGGSLMRQLGLSNLFAFNFNMNTPFSKTLFKNDFNGKIRGSLKGRLAAVNVPEPATLALLGLGVLLIGFVNRFGRHKSSDDNNRFYL